MSDLLEHHHHHCFQYTALGNSIAFGEGATINYGYVNYFRDFFATIFRCVNLDNQANPGFTSSDLLHQLKTDADAQEAVKRANLITIGIGGNDLLKCLLQPTPIIPACLSNAVATFAQNWPLIMKEIRKRIRSHAEIFVMTLYNPFKGDETQFFNLAETAIQNINNVIKANRSTLHYEVVDVHGDFLGQFTNTTQWKVCTLTHFCELNTPRDPHPTDSGHLEIARLHELKYLKNHRDKLCLVADDVDPGKDESSDDSSD